jgi:restriction endonuclease S subunit
MITYSIIKKSQIEGAHRLDAEYYQPEILEVAKKLDSIPTKTISEISESVLSFGAYSLTNYIKWEDSGIPYLKVENIKDGFIDFSEVNFISEEIDKILRKSQVKEGQVIITMAGTIGNTAVAHRVPEKVNSNQATAKITLKNGYSPYYLTAFLNSYYGRKQIEREIVSSVQPNIFLWQIKNFKVPILPKEKQKEIEEIYKKGLNELENSKSLYSQAEDLLLEELGLKDFKVNEDLTYFVKLSDIKSAHRADAEYFQPKYGRLIKYLKSKFSLEQLNHLADKQEQKIKPNPQQFYKYIEISDIKTDIGEVNYNERIGSELPPNARIPINSGELIVSKVRPTRKAIAIIPDFFINNTICSSAFTVFKSSSPLKEYIFITLRSIVGLLQLEQPTTGSEYPTLNDEDVENVFVPLLPQPTQQKIATLVQQSHEARKKAKELLEEAKQRIENLIKNAE